MIRFAIAVLALLITVLGASAIVVNAQVSCSQLGNQTFCGNGQTFSQFGNQTFDNRGNSWTQLGNQTFGSNGRTCTRIGNQLFCN